MSTNKNAVIRYRVLDRCLRNFQKKFYIQDLIEACSNAISDYTGIDTTISRRTIYNDLNFMQSEAGWGSKGLEICAMGDGRRKYYRYSDPKFSIDNTPLTSLEISQLDSAVSTLSQFRGLPQFEWMNEILTKLKVSSNNKEVVGFDHNPDLVGYNDFFDTIYQAIINEYTLLVDYKAFGWEHSVKYTIHPYYLKEYNNRWFLFGLNQDNGVPTWNMALDRIVHIERGCIPYVECSIDWEDYFGDIIGVTMLQDTPIEEVLIRCYGKSGQYIINKPIHWTQRHKWISDDCLEVRIKVRPNFELKNFILGPGANLEVVSPRHLRDEIHAEIQRMQKRYD